MGVLGRSGDVERQARILRYWRAVEYFSPQNVEGPSPSNGIVKVRQGTKLPWEPPVRRIDDKYVWRHTVYAGIFETAKVREVLKKVLPASDTDHDEGPRNRGRTALLSITVDGDGRLFKDGVVLSSCAWALGRSVVPPGPGRDDWLDGFDDQQKRILAVLFDIGDGRVAVETSGAVTTGGQRALRLIANTTARVALDVVNGGLASIPAVIGSIAESHLGPIAKTVAEKMSQSVTDDAIGAIKKRGDKKPDASGTEAGDGDEGDNTPDQLGTKVLTVADLAAITRWVAEQLGVDDVLEPTEIWVKSFQVPSKRANEVSSDEFINSFYAKDLELVAGELLSGNMGAALTSYLCEVTNDDLNRRIDVRKEPHVLLRSLTPRMMPLGRWPSDPAHPLTLSQQFAINQILCGMGDPASSGLYSVNGPPGTGKTTMLRDLIAALVVERATRLARLPNPRAAFQSDENARRWPCLDGPYQRTIVPLVADLTGFEMVVASSNNGAVENITLEVPSVDAIDGEAFPDADYLSEPATRLAGEPCWGAIAARLGRRSNRGDFVQRFWWGPTERAAEQADAEPRGLSDILGELKNSASDTAVEVLSWDDAVARFDAAVAEVARLTEERQTVADILERIVEPDRTLAALRGRSANHQDRLRLLQDHRRELATSEHAAESAAQRATNSLNDSRRALHAAEVEVGIADDWQRRAQAELYQHAGAKPGWFKRLWSRNALGDWESDAQPFVERVAMADARVAAAERDRDQRAAACRERQRQFSEASRALVAWQERIIRCDDEIRQALTEVENANRCARQREIELEREADLLARARVRWPHTLPGDEWTAEVGDRAAMERREKSSPWMDEEFAAARSRVFLAALDLHRALLTAEPRIAWNNLRAVVDIVKGDAPTDLPAETVLAAWQMLFMVVPVVSTTFASMPTMFAALGREALGWLIVDEAGQATPQAVVGALWRCRRAVVVGDPRQLEPVVTLPWSGQRRLCGKFEVDVRWAPQATSVQAVSDRVNRYGTWLPDPDGEGQIWVGSPLRVHRRCDRLMFEVSNQIAYDNMMVYGVVRTDDFSLGAQNLWINVDAPASGDKWNEAEGKQVLSLLGMVRTRLAAAMDEELAELGADLPDWAVGEAEKQAELQKRFERKVFIVSPFRRIVERLQGYLTVSGLSVSRDCLGTVHTTQGKEADIVILVLGTAADEKKAREWASDKPNLLNVAVTRARRRLVLVGDHGNWRGLRYFSSLDDQIKPEGLLKLWSPGVSASSG